MGKKDAHQATQIVKPNFKTPSARRSYSIRQDYINVVTQQHNVALNAERVENYEKLVHVIENRIGVIKAQPLLLMRAQFGRDQALMDFDK